MVTKVLTTLFNRTLNSVYFGICMMLGVGLYVAIGSGFPDLRAYFEMSDLEFFNAWPLKVLMTLLVANLIVVTWVRIPLTPPRYGVWCVHAGIIVLVLGMALHYNYKIEGMTKIPVGQTVAHFYDNERRALYMRVDGQPRQTGMQELPSLPRFGAYSDERGNTDRLDEPDLKGIVPVARSFDAQSSSPVMRELRDALGLPEKLSVDVTGFYPYASIVTRFVPQPGGTETGLRISGTDPHTGVEQAGWLVSSDRQHRWQVFGDAELEHRHLPGASDLAFYREAARHVHQIDAKVGDWSRTLAVEIGKRYFLGDTGYTLTVEGFSPAFPMFGTGELVQTLTLMVESTKAGGQKQFRRMVLNGKELQTDFLLDVEGAGPMGKRQTEPVDKDLTLLYTFNDRLRLLPTQSATKHTLVTASGSDAILHVSAGIEQPVEVSEMVGGAGQIELHDGHGHEPMKLAVRRQDGLARIEDVVEVPLQQRRNDVGGGFQVVTARLKMGDWEKEVAVPYLQFAMDADAAWDGPVVEIADTGHTLQLQLGNYVELLPAKLTLEKFELVPYAGGDGSTGPFRDFKSTVTVEDLAGGGSETAVAHMNNPIYFAGGRWLFFQSAWDPNGQRWTILGVGTRPAVNMMTLGCVMIVFGVIYAFYLKPVIIRRMKQKALAEAAKRKGSVDVTAAPQPLSALPEM